MKFKYSPDINLGHICTIFMLAVGGIGVVYRHENAISSQNERITKLENAYIRDQDHERAYQSEIRALLNAVLLKIGVLEGKAIAR